jgi:histidine triad (HIT) family protein
MQDCVFCRIVDRKLPARIVHEDNDVIAFHDIRPAAPVHVLICPRLHIPTLNDLPENAGSVLVHMFDVARNIAGQLGVRESGYRTMINVNAEGGQTVFHLHLHVIGGRQLAVF